jgi:GNAT superfamily N-acetyltransferase
MNVEYRAYHPDDSVEACAVLNRAFPKIQFTHDAWEEVAAKDFAAPIALLDGRIVGAIPMKRRVYRIAPGCDVAAWVQYRVGVAPELQRRGIGSGMQAAIKGFLHSRGDILLINTCGQGTPQYRFYRRNGFYDVACPQHFEVRPIVDGSTSDGFHRVSEEDFYANRASWIDLFENCYDEVGGYPLRTGAYPFDHLSLLHRRSGSSSAAYATIGPPDRPAGYVIFVEGGSAINVQELAVRDDDEALTRQLLDALRSHGRPVSLPASRGTTLWHILHEPSLSESVRVERTRPIIVHILNVETTADRVWRQVPRLDNVTVKVRTNVRDAILRPTPSGSREITLELHEATLSRLLMRRIDLVQAVAEERIAVTGADQADIDALADALPPCPWVYHRMDGL